MTEPEELGPEEEAEYAELLAAYLPPEAPEEAVPAHVAGRLDATLTELVAERRREVPPSVTPARRRRLGGALLAAAAVTVGGFAVSTAVDGGGEGADSAVSADAGGGDADGGGAVEEGLQDSPGASLARLPGVLPTVRRDHVEQDVRRVVDGVTALSADAADGYAGQAGKELRGDRSSLAGAREVCAVPDLRRGETWVLVRYAGRPAVVVAERRGASGPRSAVLLPCDGGAALAEVTLGRPDGGDR